MKNWSVKSEFNFLLNGMVKTRSHMVQMMVYIYIYIWKTDVKHCFGTNDHSRRDKNMNIWSVKSMFHFLSIGMVKTRSHMVQMKVYIAKTEVKHCFGTKHHFHWDKFMKIWSVKSEFNFLLNGMVKTRSQMVQMMDYIRKTDHKQWFGSKHHFHWDKFMKIGPVKSENHFLSI